MLKFMLYILSAKLLKFIYLKVVSEIGLSLLNGINE